MKQAGIYVNDTYCGVLTEDEEGFHFVYDETYLVRTDAVSLSPTMSFTVGGTKSGFDRNTFMTAFTQSGIPVAIAEKMIERMKGYLPEWEELIGQSFLPENMKADYLHLLSRRIEQLG